MSLRRIVRFIVGIIVAGILLSFILPFAGIPKSHFLPPPFVYNAAQGVTKGLLTGKYYEETSNPFHVGGHMYFVNYLFKAHTPPPRGQTQPGPVQTYQGTVRVDQGTYDSVRTTDSPDKYKGDQLITAVPGQVVRVKYEKTYPEISGISADRNIGPGSNILSGWLLWVVVTVFVGYLLMMLFEQFGTKENL